MIVKHLFNPLPRAKNVTDRLVAVLLSARFMDELLSGLPTVLMPTIRSQFGLSYTQISLLSLALNYVATVIEPVGGLLIDLWKRPWLMAWGAAGIGLATMVMGIAPTFIILITGFGIYGLASGPLAHTADVILVESYPTTPERIYSRSTLVDTFGALLAPLSVSFIFWIGLEWRWLMLALGLSSVVYAILILRTRFPRRTIDYQTEGLSWKQAIRSNIRLVLTDRKTGMWLLFLFIHAILESPMVFTTVWLREQVGMSQSVIGLYRALEMAVSIVSLIALDRWLTRSSHRRILSTAGLGLLVLYPAWIFVPGIWPRFLLSVPISFLFTIYWPIGKSQSLASIPGRGGTISAVQSLMAIIPLPLFFGLLAESISLTPAMLWVTLGGTLILLAIVWLLPDNSPPGDSLVS